MFGFSSLAPKKIEQCKTYWEVETDPFMVQFFEPNTSISDAYRLNDLKFEVLPQDLV